MHALSLYLVTWFSVILSLISQFNFVIYILGWYNNKVAGLFGTMDNEPSTDLIRPNRVVELDLTSLAQSWDVSPKAECKTVENLARKMVPVDDKLTETCNNFFRSQR